LSRGRRRKIPLAPFVEEDKRLEWREGNPPALFEILNKINLSESP